MGFNSCFTSYFSYSREKEIQAAKGSGCGKQADCKAQGRDRRFEAGAFRVQIRS